VSAGKDAHPIVEAGGIEPLAKFRLGDLHA
jgi:hypothetical protein